MMSLAVKSALHARLGAPLSPVSITGNIARHRSDLFAHNAPCVSGGVGLRL
jgi:hypothetical protein